MFVSFEGVDGSGKTTQARMLTEMLASGGREVVATREPGGTALGESVRDLLLHGEAISPWAEAALFAASRAQLVAEVIRPALARGASVVCDRFVDSSLAYQAGGRGLELDDVLALNLAVTDGILPDLTVLVEVDVATAERRLAATRDRIELEGTAFLARVAIAYAELARRFPGRYVVVDGCLPPDEIAAIILRHVRDRS